MIDDFPGLEFFLLVIPGCVPTILQYGDVHSLPVGDQHQLGSGLASWFVLCRYLVASCQSRDAAEELLPQSRSLSNWQAGPNEGTDQCTSEIGNHLLLRSRSPAARTAEFLQRDDRFASGDRPARREGRVRTRRLSSDGGASATWTSIADSVARLALLIEGLVPPYHRLLCPIVELVTHAVRDDRWYHGR